MNKYGAKGKPLDIKIIDNILFDKAVGISNKEIGRKYSLAYYTINNLLDRNKDKLDNLYRDIAEERDKHVKSLILQKRADIIESITPETVRKASLSQKTSAAVDLTQIKRLESGQSTENVAINVNSADELLSFIQGRNVNKEDTPPNQIDLNASNPIKDEID